MSFDDPGGSPASREFAGDCNYNYRRRGKPGATWAGPSGHFKRIHAPSKLSRARGVQS